MRTRHVGLAVAVLLAGLAGSAVETSFKTSIGESAALPATPGVVPVGFDVRFPLS